MDKEDVKLYTHTQWNPIQPLKRTKIFHLQQHGWTRKVLLFSEINHTENDKYCILSLICRIFFKKKNVRKQKSAHRYRKHTSAYQWGQEGERGKIGGRSLIDTNC